MKSLLLRCSLIILFTLSLSLTFAQSNVILGTGTKNTGTQNVFVGANAGAANFSGFNNTFLGNAAGQSNTTGNSNVFIGDGTGFSNTISRFNTFIGNNAGQNNKVGNANVFIGHLSGLNNQASFNTFVGQSAGLSNTTGNENVFFGSSAGLLNTTGEKNIFMGSQAGESNTNGSFNTIIGHSAGKFNRNGFGNLFLGNTAGFRNVNGSDNILLGSSAGENNATGSRNIFIGPDAGTKNINGFNNIAIGFEAGPGSDKINQSVAIGFRAQVTVSNALVLGSVKDKNGATENTKVGIGLTNPTHQLQLSTDDAAKAGSSSWKVASDKRLKKDIKPFNEGLETIKQINPVWFKYNGKAGLPTDKKYVGVIAQEMQKVADYTVDKFTYEDASGKKEEYLNYDANALTYMLVNAVKEIEQKHQEEIKSKDNKITALKNQLSAIEKKMDTEIAELKSLFAHAGNIKSSAGNNSAARLSQNEPNPATNTTSIRYFIPFETSSAEIRIFDLNGQQIDSFILTEKGDGQVDIATYGFASGTYIYHLMIDGQSIDTRKMILAR